MQYRKYIFLFCFLNINIYGIDLSSEPSLNTNFLAPDINTNLIGRLQWTQALENDSFEAISQRFKIGYHEIEEANPGISNTQIQAGTIIVLPTQFILPTGARKGIVINLAELRLYYYHQNQIYTYPIGIGRDQWETPLGPSRIIEKLKNPTWYVPKSIREDAQRQGVTLPEKIPPGENNLLGPYVLRLHYHNYLIHGTRDLRGVGRRSTAGCIRMFPEDAKALYEKVNIGTPVSIIHAPYKAGWDPQENFYVEAHVPLQVKKVEEEKKLIHQVVKKAVMNKKVMISSDIIERIQTEQLGIPLKIPLASCAK